ncbi:MAG TPA: aldehyde ferredoxin oxidoreductase C-terminal domain-containing protein [Smithellaceae bacterium]|nr:aldehyde ferredoxin oxidoreductase C-terminal domain-containing protein [Smithellaceae bacterium]
MTLSLSGDIVGSKGCYKGCILLCGRIAKVGLGKWETPVHEGAEYESISAFTAFILNEDVDAAVHATYLCNEYGLDTISTGAVLAFAMEGFEKGIITQTDLEDLDMSWGNMDSSVKMIHKIANRDGFGDILANGVSKASKIIGKNSGEFAINVKGLEEAKVSDLHN